jgi:hypothetical protein
VGLDNNNFQSSNTMKISTMPMSSKVIEQRDKCIIKCSSAPNHGDVYDSDDSNSKETFPKSCCWQEESKVPLNSGIKTERSGREPTVEEDGDGDAPDVTARVTQLKTLSCQDQIEDLNMEKIGRYCILICIINFVKTNLYEVCFSIFNM